MAAKIIKFLNTPSQNQQKLTIFQDKGLHKISVNLKLHHAPVWQANPVALTKMGVYHLSKTNQNAMNIGFVSAHAFGSFLDDLFALNGLVWM